MEKSQPEEHKHINVNDGAPKNTGETLDEAVIWKNFKNGSQSALIYMYRNYANALYNYGRQFTSSNDMVRDAIQDLFIELIQRKHKLADTSSIKFYLFKALRNKLIRMTGKEQSKGRLMYTLDEYDFQLEISPENILIYRQLDERKQRIIKEKLNELPPLQREALLLYFYEGLSYQQIAAVLDIKVKSSRALMYRAIRALAKLLRPWRNKISLLLTALTMGL